MPGAGPELALARRNAAAVAWAVGVIRDAVPNAGSHVYEFITRHGLGSGAWSTDGFTRV
ncbi:MAG: hypothetical protein JOZ42_13980 [Acetobacteraceae bacterium]|nr:hypothetical protein [Acetobacteraceae bacterium]